MGCLIWICMLPFVLQVDSYVLMTADVDDVHNLAKQVLESPVVQQLKDIWRTASHSFNKQYTRFRADDDESENSDPTYVLARKVLKLPVVQHLKAIISSATNTFNKYYRAQDDHSENSDPTYVLARKVLKLPVVQHLKAIISSATNTFNKYYRAQDDHSGIDSKEQKALKSKRKNFDRRKAVDQFLELGRNASIYLRSMKELFQRL